MVSKDVVFVRRTKLRMGILNSMKSKAANASGIAKELDCFASSVSRVFADLTNRKLIFCITPELTNFRLYELTKKGRTVLKQAEKL